MNPKLFLSLALVLSGVFFETGCATEHSNSNNWQYMAIKRLDYPGLNDGDYSSLYAFHWKDQLNRYEQQGWSVDSVTIKEEGLTENPIKAAIIVLKRKK